MKKIANSIKLFIILSFIFGLGLLTVVAIQANNLLSVAAILPGLVILLVDSILAIIFFFIPFRECDSLMPFSSGDEICVLDVYGNLIAFLIIFIIGVMIIRWKTKEVETTWQKEFSLSWKILAAFTILIFVVCFAMIISHENTLDEYRLISSIESDAVSSQNIAICENIPEPADRDNCYLRVTRYTLIKSDCYRIMDDEIRSRCNISVSNSILERDRIQNLSKIANDQRALNS